MNRWKRWLPGLQILSEYQAAWFPRDVMAGLVLATMLVPVGIAYALASGVPLAGAVCGFLCGFWTIRFMVAAFVFDVRPYLTTPWRRAGYHTMNMVFALLPLIYAAAALKGVHL